MLHFTRTGCSPCPRVSQPPDSRLVCAESPLLRQRRFELPARSPCRPQSARLGGGHAAVGLGSAGGGGAVLSGGAARWALGTALGSGCSKLHGLTAPGEVRMGCNHGAAGPGTPPDALGRFSHSAGAVLRTRRNCGLNSVLPTLEPGWLWPLRQ